MGSSTYVGGSHLTFRKLPLKAGTKLHEYNIINRIRGPERIGIIHWRGGWRQYVSQTDPGVDMSHSCHIEVARFISELMKEWRMRRNSLEAENKAATSGFKKSLEAKFKS